MPELDSVKSYWELFSKSVPDEYKDHWIDELGNPVSQDLFHEIAVYVLSHLCDSIQNPKILEVGCGTGRILERMSIIRPDMDMWGIDFSSEQIRSAKRKIPDSCQFFTGDLKDFLSYKNLNKSDKSFDLIFLHGVTQYFPSELYFHEFINMASSALTPGGTLLMLDCPVTWYLDQMRGKPKTTALTPIKNFIKDMIGYKPRVQAAPKRARETIGKQEIDVPVFSGYWIRPENMLQLCSGNFQEVRMEYQAFYHKPVIYKKYRPNFVCKGKV